MKFCTRTVRVLSFLSIAFTALAPLAAQTVSTGQTAGGAHYRFIVPDDWNGALVIWNHGFSLSPVGPLSAGDTALVEEFATLQGYAVAASSYQQTGWAVFKTDADLENMVVAFEDEFGVPDEVLLIGASLGGIVSASALERADLGNVTGALLFCGVVGGSRNWDAALDARLLYDAVCSKKKYRIAGGVKGLEKNSTLSLADVNKRVNKCFGDSNQRSKKQEKRLAEFNDVAQIPENFIQTVMGYATFAMSDLVFDKKKMKGKQGAGNKYVDYGDAKINAKIERFAPKSSKERKLLKNVLPSGKVGDVKIISIHTDKDGLVIVENQSEYAKVVPPANLTVGVVVEDVPSHCDFTNAELIGAWESLRSWIDGGAQPTAGDLQDSCRAWEPLVGGPCRIDADFVVPDMDGRVRPRG